MGGHCDGFIERIRSPALETDLVDVSVLHGDFTARLNFIRIEQFQGIGDEQACHLLRTYQIAQLSLFICVILPPYVVAQRMKTYDMSVVAKVDVSQAMRAYASASLSLTTSRGNGNEGFFVRLDFYSAMERARLDDVEALENGTRMGENKCCLADVGVGSPKIEELLPAREKRRLERALRLSHPTSTLYSRDIMAPLPYGEREEDFCPFSFT
jgi:hypothetical protein